MVNRHTCMLCEAVCGLLVEHDGERATGVRGDVDDVFSQGHICPKAVIAAASRCAAWAIAGSR